MYRLKSMLLVLGLIATIASGAARAEILFDNGAPDLGTANQGGAAGYFADTSLPSYAAGDIITPTHSGTADSINFAGLYYAYNGVTAVAQPQDSFTVYFYSVIHSLSDKPGSLLGQTTVTDLNSSVIAISGPTGVDPGQEVNFPIYQYSGQLATPFTLVAGTEYFVAIGDMTKPTSYFSVDVTAKPGPATNGFEVTDTGVFAEPGASLAFSLSAQAVPEPSTWILMLGGSALLVYWRAKKSRA